MVDDLVCIIGPDGSGKSTQCELLQEEFDRRGIEYEYRWFRFRHYLTLPLLLLARVAGLSEVEELESGRKVGYHYFWKSRLLSFLYPRILLLDMFLGYLWSIRPVLRAEEKTLIADRYVYDTLVHIAVSTRNPAFHQSRVAQVYLWMVPPSVTAVALLAESEVLRERRDDVEHDATIDRKIEQYHRLADDLGLTVVDASGSIEEVQEVIEEHVFGAGSIERHFDTYKPE